MRADPSYYPTAHGTVNTINIYGLHIGSPLDGALIARLDRQVAARSDISGHFLVGNPITLWFVPDENRKKEDSFPTWPEYVGVLHEILMKEFWPEALTYGLTTGDWYVRETDGTVWRQYCASTKTHYPRPDTTGRLAS